MSTVGTDPLSIPHKVWLLQNGQEFFPALIAAFEQAQHSIQIETYIFRIHGAVEPVVQALCRAAARGVKVRLMTDGFGTAALPRDWAQRMQDLGVQWHRYMPLGYWGFLLPRRWRRLHRKMCVVDGVWGFCGGVNFLDDHFDPNHGLLQDPRLDFTVRLMGPVVQQMQATMAVFWQRTQAMQELKKRAWADLWRRVKASRRAFPPAWSWASVPDWAAVDESGLWAPAQLLLRDNLRHRSTIEKAYLKAIECAQDEIVIANAYFLPGARLRKALIAAAQRGVRVRLLLQGRYEYFMQYYAARRVYHDLLAAGVEIYEYSQSFLHAKVAVVDPHHSTAWATVGSSNLDPLSLLLAREANVQIFGADFAQVLHERLERAIQEGGQALSALQYARRSGFESVLTYGAYAVMRLALWLSGKRY